MSYFNGRDRIAFSEDLKRPIRMGSPEELNVTDFKRIKDALIEEDEQEALNRLQGLHPMYMGMNSTFYEWCLALPHELAKHRPELEPEITGKTYELFMEESRREYGKEAATTMVTALKDLTPQSVVEFRDSNNPALLAGPQQLFDELAEKIRSGDMGVDVFEQYFAAMRNRHDLAGAYASLYTNQIQERTDQQLASRVAQDALESCAMLQGYWENVKNMSPEVLAAFMAEHLRGHFSGKDRGGAVRVEEDEEKYRLIFEPCGSGGAIRQRDIKGIHAYPKATPETWNRKGEVPPYCAHCALNELTSFKKLGYIAWVTEFDPDPKKPCGWTIYKNKEDIPEKYYQRLSLPKPS